jgi:hypothetical protein
MIIGIDPGNENTAMVIMEEDKIIWHSKESNDVAIERLKIKCHSVHNFSVFIEGIYTRGMPMSQFEIDTAKVIGRFMQVCIDNDTPYEIVDRRHIKVSMCGTVKAKDSNIRQAIIDRYGGKEKAIGNKKAPGPLYGIVTDEWQALAICLHAKEKLA